MPRPYESFGDVTDRSGTPSADMMHAFFDRFENLCPRYVSRLPSMLLGLIVFNILMTLFMDSVVLEKRMHSSSLDPTLKMRWILMLIVVVGISAWVGGKVQDRMYMKDSLEKNKDHFALTFWLGQYAKSMKG